MVHPVAKPCKVQSTPVSSNYDISEISVYIAATLQTTKNGTTSSHRFFRCVPSAAPSEDK